MSRSSLSTSPLPEIVKEAWETGQTIDLATVGYGRIHWGNKQDVDDHPHPYYYFLAGIVRTFGLSRILEIGTHWGGATRAMHRGMIEPTAGKIVTVDITTESDNRLKSYPDIVKVVGDANIESTMTEVLTHFGNRPVDLIYIDALHFAMPTFQNYALYTAALRPKVVVFDDITLNEEMSRSGLGYRPATSRATRSTQFTSSPAYARSLVSVLSG